MTTINKTHGPPVVVYAINPSDPKEASQSKGQAVSGADKPEEVTESSPKQPATNSSAGPAGLTERELKLVQELNKIDSEVRTHEMAHIAAGGQFVRSGANLKYIRGPDGNNYAVAGEVAIDTSPVQGDPRSTMEKMRRIQAAAFAPASPSSQDRAVAARAAALAAKASAELIMLMTEDRTYSAQREASTPFNNAIIAYKAPADGAGQQGTLLNTSS